jgi:RHS repeat-associated protein
VPVATDTETPTPTPTETTVPAATETETPTPTPTYTETPTPTATTAGVPTEPPPAPLEHAYYIYDGDGNLVKSIVNETVTYFVGKYYTREVNGSSTVVKKYYTAGAKTIAMRTIEGSTNTLNWLLTDHLGSTSVSANEDGSWNSTIKYTAFGETRDSSGVTPTKYRYTGQLLEAEVGLYYYVARWYDPVTMHFTQADTIVPNATDSTSYDRYAYVLNNPVRYSDPSGHFGERSSMTACIDGNYCNFNNTKSETVLSLFGVKLTNGTATWDTRDKLAVVEGVVDVAIRQSSYSGEPAIRTFRNTFETFDRPLEFRKMESYDYYDTKTETMKTATGGAYTVNSHLILVTRLAQTGPNRSEAFAFFLARNNIVHEFGHTFQASIETIGRNIPESMVNDDGWPKSPSGSNNLWRQHPCFWDVNCIPSEVFADMFLGWVYNVWGKDKTRFEYMDNEMDKLWRRR